MTVEQSEAWVTLIGVMERPGAWMLMWQHPDNVRSPEFWGTGIVISLN